MANPEFPFCSNGYLRDGTTVFFFGVFYYFCMCACVCIFLWRTFLLKICWAHGKCTTDRSSCLSYKPCLVLKRICFYKENSNGSLERNENLTHHQTSNRYSVQPVLHHTASAICSKFAWQCLRGSQSRRKPSHGQMSDDIISQCLDRYDTLVARRFVTSVCAQQLLSFSLLDEPDSPTAAGESQRRGCNLGLPCGFFFLPP